MAFLRRVPQVGSSGQNIHKDTVASTNSCTTRAHTYTHRQLTNYIFHDILYFTNFYSNHYQKQVNTCWFYALCIMESAIFLPNEINPHSL